LRAAALCDGPVAYDGSLRAAALLHAAAQLRVVALALPPTATPLRVAA
jgi:hypothetical protein